RRAPAGRPRSEPERHRARIPYRPPRQHDQRLRRKDDYVPLAGAERGHARRQPFRPAASGARTAIRHRYNGARMSYSSVTNLDGERKPPKLPARELDAVEIRILGALIEKQLATPEYYPLTLNALVAACNQKSSREPVMELSDDDVQR